MRIGLTRHKNRGFNCERFARIDSRESRCESHVPLSSGANLPENPCSFRVVPSNFSENCAVRAIFWLWGSFLSGIFLGGVTEGGGFHTRVRGTMFVRDGAVTPGPSRKCDITFFVKGRPKSARQSRDSTVAARSVQSVTVPSSRVSRECRSPGLRPPPFKNARFWSLRKKGSMPIPSFGT